MKSKNSMETKINKEGGDTMAAATKITQEQIDELIRKGKANKGVLTYGDVMNLTNTLEDITPEDVEHIYEVITRKGLELVDDDNASDEDILPLVGNDEDNDEPSSSELENMSALTILYACTLRKSAEYRCLSVRMRLSSLSVWTRAVRQSVFSAAE